MVQVVVGEQKSRSQPILGADFISKTKIVLDLGRCRRYFTLAATVLLNLFSAITINFVHSTCPFLPVYPKCSP